MKIKKLKYTIIYSLAAISIFIASFYITNNILTSNSKTSDRNKISDSKVVNTSQVEKIFSDSTSVTLNIMNSNVLVESKKIQLKEVASDVDGKLSISNVKKYFTKQGFTFVNEDENGLTFLKNSMYVPNKYYLGVTPKGFVAIFKCSSEGKLYIEDMNSDVTDMNKLILPTKVRMDLEKYAYVFDTKEEAQNNLMSLSS
ncbi:hypothetical protein IAI10_12405 [Clostridium sp. 19966]|uniref:hypothetical protein n=1 Tax=Clostridium sp. 19966 TaxID=2768166 RepID=UPI0028DE4E59|nr:hypothetical protein [Clostridium sp. 19966]MDT8717464.1 hypothetical protein [Clostridium sp. 19966]